MPTPFTIFQPYRKCLSEHSKSLKLLTLEDIQKNKLTGTFNFIIINNLTKDILICEDIEHPKTPCSLLPYKTYQLTKFNNHSNLYAEKGNKVKEVIGFGELLFEYGVFKELNNISSSMQKPNEELATKNIEQSFEILQEKLSTLKDVLIKMSYICHENCGNALHKSYTDKNIHTIIGKVV